MQSVKLPDDILVKVREEADLQGRSIAGQVTHWLKIGRAIEKSKAIDHQRIRDALKGALSPDELTPEEQNFWRYQFVAKMSEPQTQDKVLHEKRHKLGRGVGMRSSGELFYEE